MRRTPQNKKLAPDSLKGSQAEEKTPSDDPVGQLARTCPECGGLMVTAVCKLRCNRCHYYESCSDF